MEARSNEEKVEDIAVYISTMHPSGVDSGIAT
jgi:hypothetical protein